MSKFLIDKIFYVLKQPVAALGFNIIQISLKKERRMILEILIERMDLTSVTINDCSFVSKNVSTLLDIENIITHEYFLEVSSPGIERPLLSLSDYVRFIGYFISVKLFKPLDYCHKYKGKILRVIDENIHLQVNSPVSVVDSVELISKEGQKTLVSSNTRFTKLERNNIVAKSKSTYYTEKIIDFNLIKKANLVLTDEIFKKLLNKKYEI